MTREEFFYQCMDIIEHWLNGDRKLSDLREVTDKLYNEVTRPHWISVDEESELPKEHEWILGYSLKREYIDVYNFDSNGLIEAHGITHWMPLPEKPKGGEEMERLTVEWQDPCNNHREKIRVLLYEKGMTSKEIVERLCDVYKNEHVDLETLLYWAIQTGYNKCDCNPKKGGEE